MAVKSLIVALAKVDSPVTFRFELMLATPVTVSVLPSNVRFVLSATSPLAPVSYTLPFVKSVKRRLPNAALPKLPLNTLDVSVASFI